MFLHPGRPGLLRNATRAWPPSHVWRGLPPTHPPTPNLSPPTPHQPPLKSPNTSPAGDTLVLERWTQDRSVLHLRITRSAAQQLLPLGTAAPAAAPAGDIPPQLQAMLGAAEAAAAQAALALSEAPPPPPMPEPLPQAPQGQQAEQQAQQAQQVAQPGSAQAAGGSGSPVAGSSSPAGSGASDAPSSAPGDSATAEPAMPAPQPDGGEV